MEVLLDTPNSKTKRYVALNVNGGIDPSPHFKVALDSPIKKVSAEFLAKRSEKEHSLKLTLTNDDNDYFARVGVESLGGNKYKPLLEYKIPEQIERLAGKDPSKVGQTHQIQGTVEVGDHEGGKKYAFNNVELVANGKRVAGIDGNAAWSPKSVDVDLNLGNGEDKLNLKVDGKRLGDKEYIFNAYATPSKNPANAVGIEASYSFKKPTLDSKIALVQGPDFKDENNRITLSNRGTFDTDPQKFEISFDHKFAAPKFGHKFEAGGKLTKKSVDANVDFKYNKLKFGADLSGKINTKNPGDYEVELEARALENKLKVNI